MVSFYHRIIKTNSSVIFSNLDLSRTAKPILTKLGTNHPCLKGIQVCSYEGPRPFPRGDNCEITKIHWRNFKIFFSRITGPISTKLGTEHPWVKDRTSLGEGDLSLFKWRATHFLKGKQLWNNENTFTNF